MTRRLLALTRPFLLLSACVLLTCGAVAAHDDHDHGPRIEPAEQHGPSPLPDRIVLTWTGDPARSQDITWRTDSEVDAACAEFAVAEPGPQFATRAKRVDAKSESFTSDLGDCRMHSVHLADLSPKTKYAYRVGDGIHWSEWFHFTTAAAEPEPFTFVYFGDAQNEVRSLWSRVIREAHLDAPRAAFMLHAGDLVNRANRDAEWGEWFGAGGWLNAMTPSIATPGNHEYARDEDDRRRLTDHWRPQFAFPQNGPDGLKESVYWIDYQGVRIISLNSNEQQEEQVPWVEEVLADNPSRWTIVTFHHPLYSAAKDRDNARLRNLWKPIFDKHRVDLVLQGHDHAYARSSLDVPDVPTENVAAGVNAKTGPTVYVVSVSGPKMYDVKEGRPFISRSASGAQLYQLIHIDGDELLYEARVATGELYDSFLLKKREGEVNELVEKVPDTPELRK